MAGLHVAYTLFVVFGSLLVLEWPRLMLVHVAAVTWAGLTLLFDLGCPLTPWEKTLWIRGGVEPYPEGFLQHHVLRTRFDESHEKRNHMILGAAAIVFNAIVYFFLLRGA
jgi:hypothetical protein